MKPDELYEMYCHELETEGVDALPWELLDPNTQIAWGKLCRRLQAEHGLTRP